MQQLLDITYNSIHQAKLLKDNGMNDIRDIDIMLNLYNVYRVIIEKNMLEKEKEQIKNAFDNGVYHSFYGSADSDKKFEGEDYYNTEFN